MENNENMVMEFVVIVVIFILLGLGFSTSVATALLIVGAKKIGDILVKFIVKGVDKMKNKNV